MPENSAYLYLGLVVVIGFVGLYVLLLGLRFHSARRERELIEQMKEEEKHANH